MPNHLPIPTFTRKLLARFWNNVQVGGPDDCWLWSLFNPILVINKHRFRAARLGYKIMHGVDPGKSFVVQTCMNPFCMNPRHLVLETTTERYVRMCANRRINLKHQYGESNGQSKLTQAQVLEIRELGATKNYLQRHLAVRFGVEARTISSILTRRHWKHI